MVKKQDRSYFNFKLATIRTVCSWGSENPQCLGGPGGPEGPAGPGGPGGFEVLNSSNLNQFEFVVLKSGRSILNSRASLAAV